MNFPKAFMTKKELREIGVPEATLERVWNMKGQNIAFRACPGKKTSPIIFDTESL